MDTLTSIVAINPESAIGAGNQLPWRIRSDLRFFRQQTENQVVVMGRKTFDSLGQRGLPNRKNVVVTHGFGLHASADGCRVAHSISEALVMADDWATKRQRVYVIGGASMYKQFSPFVDRYLVTLVHKDVPEADTFFDGFSLVDSTEWSIAQIDGGRADGRHDEADYQIFEFRRTSSDQAQRRESAMMRYRPAAKTESLTDVGLLRAAG